MQGSQRVFAHHSLISPHISRKTLFQKNRWIRRSLQHRSMSLNFHARAKDIHVTWLGGRRMHGGIKLNFYFCCLRIVTRMVDPNPGAS
ncbi:uncharacterized protein LAJ45_09481 [Morchella importuna]|uniref:uncharacterized protein n=1 Tax=Morchella importuna TaxID=1174673 RepID=UPI001E8D6420|nr:uncharacterized protein LAJ45_09481 [Morchella importuna]KAH8146535.1 hypothetical protein LAJ45_09481 [Morchella importuna]